MSSNMEIKTVTVIGATGTMGANVAGIFASFGEAKVYCVGRNIDLVKKAVPRIVKSVRADSIAKNLIPADYSMLDHCVRVSDLVFESVPEAANVKSDIAKQIARNLRDDAIACTGTSGLSVTNLAKVYPPKLRKHFFGVHMFNPPYSMPLCELICTKDSDDNTAYELKEYLQNKLLRTVVAVKDSPGFLANRIGFQLINEALQYAEQYKDNGGIDYIDAIIGPFTGRAMPPLVTSDFVGLDVHKAIVNNVYENTSDYAHESFKLPSFVEQLIAEDRLGRKRGCGLYKLVKYDNGLKRLTVYDISTGLYRDVINYAFPYANNMKKLLAEGDYKEAIKQLVNNRSQEAQLCLEFLLKYIIYSLYCADKVAYSPHAADDVMATGFNWCPPIAMYEAINAVVDVEVLIKERLPELTEAIDAKGLFKRLGSSKYDYRRFFKSGR